MFKKYEQFRYELQKQEAFNKLKIMLCERPVPNIHRQGGELVHSDASAEKYDATLLQKSYKDNLFHPIYYVNKKTMPSENSVVMNGRY